MFNQEKPQTLGKTNHNEISLALEKTLASLAKWAFTTHIQSLHYNEVLQAFYRVHYMQ